MTWKQEIDELEYLRGLAHQMGGDENVKRHHAKGKLTVRERIAALADPGSFEEIGTLAGNATYEGNTLKPFRPCPVVMGLCNVDGRRVIVDGSDFTVRGGAGDESLVLKKGMLAPKMAFEWRIPYIHILDSVGGSVRAFEEIGATYIPYGPGVDPSPRLLQAVPVVAAVMGSVAGLPAVQACFAHFSVMVKGTSQIFVAGPPVVKAALGQETTKETLGNELVHAHESGVIDNVAENEMDAFYIIRRFLSYMPSNVWEMPPYKEPSDDPDRREEALLSIIPRDRKKPYDPLAILRYVLDKDSIFEISPYYGRSRITTLARVNGYPVGVMINNPYFLGGAMDVAAAEKVTRFVQMCNTFHLPVVYFADEPGFMVGEKSEKKGMVRSGARVSFTIDQTNMPWICFAIRQVYGVAGGAHYRESSMYRRYAWPSGNWGSMHVEGGAMAAFRRVIESSPDPEAAQREIEEGLKALCSPFRTAHNFGIEEIIDPRDTRPLLCKFIEMAQVVLKTQLGPLGGPAFRP